MAALSAWFPQTLVSAVTSDGGFEATRAQGINPGQHLALFDPSDQFLGLWLPRRYHPTLQYLGYQHRSQLC